MAEIMAGIRSGGTRPAKTKRPSKPGSVRSSRAISFRFGQNAIAYEKKADVRAVILTVIPTVALTAANDFRSRLNDEFMAFEPKQPGDFADHDVVVRKSELTPGFRTQRFGPQKRLHFHAAVDRREFFPRRDFSVDHQVGHGIGNANHSMAASGGGTFAEFVKFADRHVLVRIKRSAVNAVNDGRHSEFPSGGTAQDTGFGAVRVNHIGLEFAQNPAQFPICPEIVPRMNVANQRRHDNGWYGFRRTPHERAFRSGCWPGDEEYVVTVVANQVFATQKRVFLRAADDEPRDNVGDFHADNVAETSCNRNPLRDCS